MQYIVDGHNLIPVLGLSLSDPEDEEQLLAILQGFARGRKMRITVYFDGAPQANTRSLGAVRAVFVPKGQTADAAIMRALQKAGGAARNLSVVSSDRQVIAAAKAAHAAVLSSRDFAGLIRAPREAPTEAQESPYPSPTEVAEWEALFRQSGENLR